ncbi:MAG: MBL fold metallo-hydrolase [Micromonosporaceae bacterium]|nr:MBL fold metallo-hydrolase [Micromonosporaceae bacterium]
MKLIKFTHACVRLESANGVLVIDPGIWSEPAALSGADAVLVTHEHADHVDRLRLAGLGAPVYAPAGAEIPGLDVRPVSAGDRLSLAGFSVRAMGGRHAHVYGEQPDCVNLGYLVDDLYHPGDSLHVPDQAVGTLLVPAHASWLKLAEAIDFVKAVRPRRMHPIHDGQVNERALASINDWFTRETDAGYRYLPPGATA